jgi:two-component system sensor histidine kinase KdpD
MALTTQPKAQGWFFSISVILVCSLVAWSLSPFLALWNLAMLYFIGVVVVSLREAKGPSLLASVLSVLCFNFFFVPPRFTFAVSDHQYYLTFVVMLCVSLILSELTRRVRQQAEDALLREQRTSYLFAFGQELSFIERTDGIFPAATARLRDLLGAEVVVALPDGKGGWSSKGGSFDQSSFLPEESAMFQAIFEQGRQDADATLSSPSGLFFPLLGAKEPLGVLVVHPLTPDQTFTPEQLALLKAFAHLTALTFENRALKDQTHTANLRAESERLRSSLLSSVSHDLRTPLSAILGSATGLLESSSLDEKARRDLLENIRDEAERLNRLLANLLEMTRLSSGSLELKLSLHPLEEVLGAALARLEDSLGTRAVMNRIPADLPMIPMDDVLVEQLLFNLLENAVKHASSSGAIELEARQERGSFIVEVMDRGPGVPPGEEETVFEKFVRGSKVSAPGSGLGLAVARGIAEAHGGALTVTQRPGGGALFRLCLPLAQAEHGSEKNHG